MGIKLRIPVSARGLEEEILKIRREVFETACKDEKERIVERSQKEGKDFTGKPFKKYSESYAQKREKLKRRIYPPDLTMTGEMFTGLDVKFQELGNGRTEAEFYFKTASAGIKARFVNESRKFFRLSQEQLTRIKNRIRKAIR